MTVDAFTIQQPATHIHKLTANLMAATYKHLTRRYLPVHLLYKEHRPLQLLVTTAVEAILVLDSPCRPITLVLELQRINQPTTLGVLESIYNPLVILLVNPTKFEADVKLTALGIPCMCSQDYQLTLGMHGSLAIDVQLEPIRVTPLKLFVGKVCLHLLALPVAVLD